MMLKKPFIWLLILLGTAILAGIGYLLYSSYTFGIGFPLDDAWIHQTYARNLAQRGEWAFIPGQISAGSTSPLWSILLSIGYFGHILPTAWAYILGILSLFGLAAVGQMLFNSWLGEAKGGIPWMGLFLIFEWHLVWSAVSGMETTFYAMVIVLVFYLLAIPLPIYGLCGLLIGMSAWIRPDGITLLGPAMLICWVNGSNWKGKVISIGQVLALFALVFLPYLGFNRWIGGSFWPYTFYAKQAEYAIYQQINILQRFFTLAVLPVIGPVLLLLPGLFYGLWRAWKNKKWGYLAGFLWWFGYTTLYALRLPVTYQHGRYLMPSMPVFFILAGVGFAEILRDFNATSYGGRLGQKTWQFGVAGLLIGFYLLGANAYAQDVAIIETEMVRVAMWVNQNTSPESLVAAHDIGAMGYFGHRKLVDMAGLISPEVIPFIRDEHAMVSYLDQRRVDYLVTFPDWYRTIPQGKEIIYRSGGLFSPASGGENMTVYRWRNIFDNPQ